MKVCRSEKRGGCLERRAIIEVNESGVTSLGRQEGDAEREEGRCCRGNPVRDGYIVPVV